MAQFRNVIRYFVAGAVVATGFLGGFTADTLRTAPQNPAAARWKLETVPAALARSLQPAAAQAKDDGLAPDEVYEAVLNTVRSHYYSGAAAPAEAREKLGVTRLTYAAIDGMLSSIGDRYTEFFPPKEYKAMLEEQSGNFVGIGARLDATKDHRVVITSPIDGSPAAHAGIRAGDIITAVDGKAVNADQISEVIKRIRGEEDTFVKLTVDRKGKLYQYTLRRAVVQSPVVEWRMTDPVNKVGYISLQMFNEQADQQFDAALSRLERQGMKALVFDLRGNPGGLLNVAQDVASRFLPSGPVVWVKEKSGRMSSLNVQREKHRGPLSTGAYPVAVLVDGGSASASEIVSGAIQDGKAGVLVGTRTYGKGLVQTIIPLEGDSAVKITTQHYFTRNKHDINLRRDQTGRAQGTVGGITPDYVVNVPEGAVADRDPDLAESQNRALQDRRDPQLQKALSVVRQKLLARK